MHPDTIQLLKERYLLSKENTWDDLCNRMGGIYDIKSLMKGYYFIPSSPTLMNGNAKGEVVGTLSSCFPMSIGDSMEEITQFWADVAQVTKMCGGVGHDASVLRSHLETVKSLDRKSSGVVPFLRVKNEILDAIRQGGRRKGAGAAILNIFHPDVIEFIEEKSVPEDAKMERINLSVKIPDWFYKDLDENPDRVMQVQKVISKEWVDLIDPHSKKTMTVKQLWDKIILYSWQSAEPGIFNENIAYNRCSVTNVNSVVIANPCLRDTVNILTREGLKKLKDLEIGEEIWSSEGWTTVTKKWKTGYKRVYKYHTDAGVFESTDNHEVISEGKKVPIKDAKTIDILKGPDYVQEDGDQDKVSYEILRVEDIGEWDVYDITVDNRSHTFWCDGFNISNCFEFINIPDTACGLGSFNLAKYVKHGEFCWDLLKKHTAKVTRFMNKVIDVNQYPTEKIKKTTQMVRPIGVGYMGLAHALMLLGIPYNSSEGYSFINKVSRFLTLCVMMESSKMAKNKKKSYDAYNEKLFFKANERFFKNPSEVIEGVLVLDVIEHIKTHGVYNSCFTSIAPTGSISQMVEVYKDHNGLSGGMEPVFALAFIRRVEIGEKTQKYREIRVLDPIFERYISKHYRSKKKKIIEEIISNNGSCQKSKFLTDEEKAIFLTARDLTPMEHLEALAEVANNVSLSASKTVNLPKESTVEQIGEVYRRAHSLGIIGVSVYREGCRKGILRTAGEEEEFKFQQNNAPKRPPELPGNLEIIKYNKQMYFVAVGLYDDKPFEVFTGLNYNDDCERFIPKNFPTTGCLISKRKRRHYVLTHPDHEGEYILNGSHTSSMMESITRNMSLSLRHGVNVKFVVQQNEKVRGTLNDFEKVLARVLKKYIQEGDKVSGERCQNCGSENLIYTEHCKTCADCQRAFCG